MVKITKVSVIKNYRLEVTFDDGVGGWLTSLILSAKVFLPYGVTHTFSNRFKSVHSASLSGSTKLISALTPCTSK